jgi:ribose transport system permease protein
MVRDDRSAQSGGHTGMVWWSGGRPRLAGTAALLGLSWSAFALFTPGFTRMANQRDVLLHASILLLLALPMALIVRAGSLDLSMGAALGLCSVLLGRVQSSIGSPALAVAAALCAALAVGALNGTLVASFARPPSVVTLATMAIAQGLASVAATAQGTPVMPMHLEDQVPGLAWPLGLAGAAWAALHLLLYRTRFGTRLVVPAGDGAATHGAGASLRDPLVWVHVLGGAGVGLAALPMAARAGSDPMPAQGLEFDAIAAVAIGGVTPRRGPASLAATLHGVLVVSLLRNGLSLYWLPASMQVFAIGALVAAVLGIERLRTAA